MAASKSCRALNLLMSVMRAAEVLPDHVSGSCRSCSAEQVVHEPGAAAAGRESGQKRRRSMIEKNTQDRAALQNGSFQG